MGSSQSHPSWQQSRYITRMEASPQTSALQPTSSAATPDAALTKGDEPPPQLYRVESFSDKFIRKFSSQPLVPIGCVATAYFLASGIKSFRDRDPIRSQKMMRARVGAQFVTIMIFIGYLGYEQLDFRLAPAYQDKKKREQQQQQQQSD